LASYEDIVEKNKEYLIQCVPRQPVALTEGKGALAKDVNGKEYVDCFCLTITKEQVDWVIGTFEETLREL